MGRKWSLRPSAGPVRSTSSDSSWPCCQYLQSLPQQAALLPEEGGAAQVASSKTDWKAHRLLAAVP